MCGCVCVHMAVFACAATLKKVAPGSVGVEVVALRGCSRGDSSGERTDLHEAIGLADLRPTVRLSSARRDVQGS
jgi:hypothetical protein